MDRRKFLKRAGIAGVAATSVAAAALEIDGLHFVSSKRPVQTKKQHISGLPKLSKENEGGLLARLLPSKRESLEVLNYESIPHPYKEQLKSGYESGFWVIFTTIQGYESSFHPGKWSLEDGVLLYSEVNRLEEPSERDGLFYHYEFHKFRIEELVTDEPTNASAYWKDD